jgi:asparagine synthase (glutamine-hydrolysing)
MRSDVPVGFTLSGGLDSSAILQAAATDTADQTGLTAFTSVYDTPSGRSVDERHWAGLVAKRFGVQLGQVPAEASDWSNALGRIAWHMDGPGYSPAVFPLWNIMERARASGIRVLLEGQGADELLGGYAQHAAVDLWESLSRGRLLSFARAYGPYARSFSLAAITLWFVRERAGFAIRAYRRRVGALGTLDPDFIRRAAGESWPTPAQTLNARLNADLTRDILPGLLHYGDAISMANSVESRLPFLDYRLVEFASALPGEHKVGAGQTKRILRDHLRAVDLEVIANRRDKRGYPTPIDSWLAANDAGLLKSMLLAPGARVHEYCRPERLRRLIDHHLSTRTAPGNHLYRLLTTEVWLRTCVDTGTTAVQT